MDPLQKLTERRQTEKVTQTNKRGKPNQNGPGVNNVAEAGSQDNQARTEPKEERVAGGDRRRGNNIMREVIDNAGRAKQMGPKGTQVQAR